MNKCMGRWEAISLVPTLSTTYSNMSLVESLGKEARGEKTEVSDAYT